MMKKRNVKDVVEKEAQWKLSFQPVVKYILWFCVIMLVVEMIYGVVRTTQRMKFETDSALTNAQSQLNYRVDSTIKLLTSLSNEEYYSDPAIPFTEKTVRLANFSKTFGYMMVRILDKDINVYNEQGVASNLAGRDYLQRLFSTGETQVTDSFAAGADGKTMNYTIAVPLMENGTVNGGLFAAIYFDELEGVLKECTYRNSQDMMLFGSQNQVMSTTFAEKYGKTYMQLAQSNNLFGITVKQVEEKMLNREDGQHWGIGEGNMNYTRYGHIANTPWTVMCRSNFWSVFLTMLPQLLTIFFVSIAACALLMLLARRFIGAQMKTVDILVDSVQELERKIYQNEKPNEVDFKEIISLTSKGLTDGLTGVITRTVFLSQLKPRMNLLDPNKTAALCFIDVDELKGLNDNYGHSAGDMALKSVGYVLREYEKKYDGLVGRYGGDEFILLLSQLDSRNVLEEILEELSIRLHTEISTGEAIVRMHCSMGVALCSGGGEELEKLIEQADEALYAVKQSGKGTYRIYGGK